MNYSIFLTRDKILVTMLKEEAVQKGTKVSVQYKGTTFANTTVQAKTIQYHSPYYFLDGYEDWVPLSELHPPVVGCYNKKPETKVPC